MKKLWQDIRAALHAVARQAIVRAVLGLLAALGAADAVSHDPVAPTLLGLDVDRPSASSSNSLGSK